MAQLLHTQHVASTEVSNQLEHWHQTHPGAGILALVAEQDQPSVPQLQELCRNIGLPLFGAVFPEIHYNGRFYRNGALLILLNPMPDFAQLIEWSESQDDQSAQIAAVADTIRNRLVPDQPSTLLMLFDALVPNIGSLLESFYLQLAESVHYAGANAGSETFQPMPCLFDDQRLIGNGLLLVLLRPHEGAVLEHGYQVPDQLIVATSTEGNRIISIGWQPAFDAYREHIRVLYGIEVTPENFYDYAVHFPFGILRADEEVLVRIPVALEPDGSLFCVGEVPEHVVLTLLEAPRGEALQTDRLLASRLGGEIPSLLNFYCAGRRMHLSEPHAAEELQHLQTNLASTELFGALSLGEIGSSQRGGYPLFHNATLVCMKF
ncbi:MAG: FIST C-terminal domain-containing protein [Candidatus Thiodiazotropha sp.]